MEIVVDFFKLPGKQEQSFRIRNMQQLTAKEAVLVRDEIDQLIEIGAHSIYVDASNTTAVDLSGINEIIHTNYRLTAAGKEFVFVYKRNSEAEKWVQSTGLSKFVSTAILPA